MQLAPKKASGMATRCMSTSGDGGGSIFVALVSVLLLVLPSSAHLVPAAAPGVNVKAACAKTPYPEYCTSVLTGTPESKTAATARALAEVAIRATGKVGTAAGSFARSQMDAVQDDNVLWQCLEECTVDIEDALSHLDDSEGEIDDAQFNLVAQFLAAAVTDSRSCDASCRNTPPSPVKTDVLAKNAELEKMMSVTDALIKQANGGAPLPQVPSKLIKQATAGAPLPPAPS